MAASGIPAGLQSLDFKIPTRGQVFVFTTPGGDVSVTARAVSKGLLAGLVRLVCVLAGAAVVLWLCRVASWRWFGWLRRLDSKAGSILLVCLGILATILGFLVIGVALLIAGITVVVSRFRRRRAAGACGGGNLSA